LIFGLIHHAGALKNSNLSEVGYTSIFKFETSSSQVSVLLSLEDRSRTNNFQNTVISLKPLDDG
jgi:hypothetical protein